MGSGNTRKVNDKVRINTPQQKGVIGSGAGGSTRARDINNICPPAFEFIIHPTKPILDKSPLIVTGKDLFVLGDHVGEIPDRFIKIISECAGNDIHYAGHVLNKGNKAYAHFEQNFSR